MMRATIIVFLKPPRMGLSKTRLARGLGRTEARRVARLLISQTLKTASDQRWATIISTAPLRSVTAHFTPEALPLPRWPQGPGDLGERMARAFHAAPKGAVIFIGSDAPDISRRLLWQAVKATGPGRAVAGPANDGGFWLLGLWNGRRAAAPFNGVRWSSEHALSDVIDRLPEGTKLTRLATLIDIDEAKDWTAWRANRGP